MQDLIMATAITAVTAANLNVVISILGMVHGPGKMTRKRLAQAERSGEIGRYLTTARIRKDMMYMEELSGKAPFLYSLKRYCKHSVD
jgi:hypothetical protein